MGSSSQVGHSRTPSARIMSGVLECNRISLDWLLRSSFTYSKRRGSRPSDCIFCLTAGAGTPTCSILKNFL